MNAKEKIKRLLKKKVLILDGAAGTELQKRGMPVGVCPEIWCLEHPSVIQDIHRAYGEAGSDVIYTCTFGANRLKLAQYGVKNITEINKELAILARHAAGKSTFIAGDIGPTGSFVEPFGNLSFEEAVDIFKEQIRGLLAGGVDLFIVETMMDIQEARAALIALRETADYYCAVTMTYEKDGRTLNGTEPAAALITLQSLGADAVGCNCSMGPDAMAAMVSSMKPYARIPLVAKPNAGLPHVVADSTVFDMDASAFAAAGKKLAAAGANMVGGCCGTTPEHITALRDILEGEKPLGPRRKSVAALSSARSVLLVERDAPLLIIGERINPTGKKELQEEIRAGKMALVRKMAKEQESNGARLLDVNVGVPGLDEIEAMRKVVAVLSTATALPLVIDSAAAETIEAALRVYPGRALINSISGERRRMEKLFPIARKYGAMFILLALKDDEIPETADRRKAIIRDIVGEAENYGFTRDDIIVDGLVMTVASNPASAQEALKTIAWCTDRLKCRSVLGVSNIAFGMPERKWINAAFLSMAQAEGLTMAIANPGNGELMNMKAAGDVLMQKDKDAAAYIRRFSTGIEDVTAGAGGGLAPPSMKVYEAVIEGNREDITTLVAEAIAAGHDAATIIDDFMIPAIVRAGDLFEKREFFLPQLMASAEAMRKAMEYLKPHLACTAVVREKKGSVLIATVKGDIHDIGKNIVALMLENHGYSVIDLGKDVPAEAIIAAARRHEADVVGLSALMTTTMAGMEKVVSLAAQERLSCRFIVGGAVVTKAYAASIGAAYAKDGVEAVRVVERLVKRGR